MIASRSQGTPGPRHPDCFRPIGEPPRRRARHLAHNNVRPRVGRRKGGIGFRAFWVPWEAKWEVRLGWRPTWASIILDQEEMDVVRAAVALWVSTAEQTTDNQERELRAAAAAWGAIWWKIRDHAVSGSKGQDKRPGFR